MAVLGMQAKGCPTRTAVPVVFPRPSCAAGRHILHFDTCASSCRTDLASLARVALRGSWNSGQLETPAEAPAVLHAFARDAVAEQLGGPRRTQPRAKHTVGFRHEIVPGNRARPPDSRDGVQRHERRDLGRRRRFQTPQARPPYGWCRVLPTRVRQGRRALRRGSREIR